MGLVMVFSFACIGACAPLLGVASFVERPVGRGFDSFHVNALVRGGGLALGRAARVASHDFALSAPLSLLVGLTFSVIAGIGSICYCLALGYPYNRV